MIACRFIQVLLLSNLIYKGKKLCFFKRFIYIYTGNYKNRSNGAKDVLKSRTAVCAGYSELFYELSEVAGLNVWKINGDAKGI